MRGVIYARYSSDNQREESIEGQIRENTAYANKNGIDIVGTYIDRAYSAKTDNRPEFQRMIKDSAKKNFDVVIVWKLDLFSRNRYDSAKYKTSQKHINSSTKKSGHRTNLFNALSFLLIMFSYKFELCKMKLKQRLTLSHILVIIIWVIKQ